VMPLSLLLARREVEMGKSRRDSAPAVNSLGEIVAVGLKVGVVPQRTATHFTTVRIP
jgi:hypothetical protein